MILEPPTGPPEERDREQMREDAFGLIMADSLKVQDMIWDVLLEWSDRDIESFLDDRGRHESRGY